MKPRLKLPLALTLGAIVIAIEIVVLFALGGFYLRRFGEEVDRRLQETVKRPGVLVTSGALTTDAFGQRDTLEAVVGPVLDEAMIVTAEGTVVVALDPAKIDRHWNELETVNADWLRRAQTGPFTQAVTTGDKSFLISIAPVAFVAGEAPAFFDYVRISTDESEQEIAGLRATIIGGSVAALLTTTAALLFAVHRLVTRRVQKVATAVATVHEGQYDTPLTVSKIYDEIGFLESGFVDMTSRLRSAFESLEGAVTELSVAEAKYRALVDNAAEAIFVIQDGTVVFANPNGFKLVAASEHEGLLAEPLTKFIHPDYRAQVLENHMRRVKGEDLPTEYDFKMMRTDGTPFWAELNVVLIEWKNRPATLNFISDITERKAAESELKAGSERARLQRGAIANLFVEHPVTADDFGSALKRVTATVAEALESERASIWFLNDDASKLECACLYERSKATHSDGVILQASDYPNYFRALQTESRIAAGDACQDPRTSEFANGYLRPLGIASMLDASIQVEGRLMGVLCVEHIGEKREWKIDEQAFAVMSGSVVAQVISNSERRQAQAEKNSLQSQLLQSQKLESVGRLAGGVAHDFNNMLQSILGNVGMAIEDTSPDHPAYECLTEIRDSARRSASLTRQLLTFARKQTAKPEILDLNKSVSNSVTMLRRLIGENIELVWKPCGEPWNVAIDPSQIDQILTNLCINARDAIEGVGNIVIETANVVLSTEDLTGQDEAKPGEYVRLIVRDSGYGMDKDTLANIFEPFFTTKAHGQGTGLGLATVFGIVKQNAGTINVTSSPQDGSSFTIHLPRARTDSTTEEPTCHRESDARSEGTILLVEDEDQVLKLGRRILTQQGYNVLTASTPRAALEIARDSHIPIDLVVTDVIMPDMNGRELSRSLQGMSPDIKCLFMSGYTADIINRQGIIDEGVEFLQKPFTNRELLDKVHGLLDNDDSLSGA